MRPRRDGEPLRIVCTDRDQHAPAQLADYWHMADGGHRLTSQASAGTVFGPGDHEPEGSRSSISTQSYTLRCPGLPPQPQA